MKNAGKNRLNILELLIGGILAGMLLLFAVYLLPQGKMQVHIQESIGLLENEGDNPYLMEGYKGSSLDNYTDAIMLANAGYQSKQPFYKAAMLVERKNTEEDEPVEWVKASIEDQEDAPVVSYGRYWHGYLVLLKPLLVFLNYKEIRTLNGVFFVAVILLVCMFFVKRKMWGGMIAFGLAVMELFPMTIPCSMQFSSCFYISTLALIGLLWKYEKLEEKNAIPIYFCGIGMLTSYVDFLTYPVITFGLPMIIVVVLAQKGILEKLKKIIACGISWCVGYAGMWGGKWLIGTFVTGSNFLAEAVGMVKLRTSHETYDGDLNAWQAITRNWDILNNGYGKLLISVLIIWVVASVLLIKVVWKKNMSAVNSILLIMLAFLPVAWYCVTVNHSYIHYWYTFRGLAVFVFALGMIPEMLYRSGETEERS